MSIANQIFKELQQINKIQTAIANSINKLEKSVEFLNKEVKNIKTISDEDYSLEKELNTNNNTFSLLNLDNIRPSNKKIKSQLSTYKTQLKLETVNEYNSYIKAVSNNKKLYEEIFAARNIGYSFEQLSTLDNVPSFKRLEKTSSTLLRSGFMIVDDSKYVYDFEDLENYKIT